MTGFTLVELLVTVAIASILMTVAVPSFRSAIEQAQQDSAVYQLVGMLTLARSEAIKQSSRVSVCARADDSTCGNDWSQGWLVFLDTGATVGSIDADETVLRVAKALPTGLSLDNHARVMSSTTPVGHDFIRFGPRGTSNWRFGGTFRFCDGRGSNDAEALNISMVGDVRKAARDGSSGDLVDAYGDAVSCDADSGGA